jgi:two-component system, sensor histidine kinase and response regulator
MVARDPLQAAVGPWGIRLPEPCEAHRVLVIDDDNVILLSCRRILEKVGYEVETFDNGPQAIERLRNAPAQVLLLDLKMPQMDGTQVIEQVRTFDPSVIIVVITGYATVSAAVDAMKAGAYDFLPKPFTPEELRLTVDRCYERWGLAAESEKLRRQKDELQRKFATFVSHQLKSPLGAVKQYLDVLLRTACPPLPETALTWITRSQERLQEMLAIIEDWLTLARVEREWLWDKKATADLCTIARKTVSAAQEEAQTAQLSVVTDIAPDVVACVQCDAGILGIVMANLLGNAIKYNRPGGRVTVGVTREPDTAILTVSDTGIGIPGEWLPQLFTEFLRVKTDQTHNIPGTGLGLAICKKIVEGLGGTIQVSSTMSVGSTFLVRLPVVDERTRRGGAGK